MKINKLIDILNTSKSNLILMVGIPLSGKSTLIKEILKSTKDVIVISRDEIVLEKSNGLSYSDAFHKVNQKEVSRELNKRILEISKTDSNVIIDMMNHKTKSRKSHLKKFPNHIKYALILEPISMEILLERNNVRKEKEGKFIPVKVLEDTRKSYSTPLKEEGFDYIIYM